MVFAASVGISGNPHARPQDRFGLTYFHYSLADGPVDTLARRVPLEDEEGIEAFCTLQVAELLRMTADVQVIDPAIAARDLGMIGSPRFTATF